MLPITNTAWQAMIWDKRPLIPGQFLHCGAVILRKRFVLAAAHCVNGITEEHLRSQRFVVKTGKQRPYQAELGEQAGRIAGIAIHHRYNRLTYEDDVAVLYLDRALQYNINTASNIRLPEAESSDVCLEQQGSSALFTGWGRVSPLRSASTLRGVRLPLINTTVCHLAYPSLRITARMLCAGFGLGKRDTCHGDSGGPVAAYNQKRREWVLIGVISWGSKVCA